MPSFSIDLLSLFFELSYPSWIECSLWKLDGFTSGSFELITLAACLVFDVIPLIDKLSFLFFHICLEVAWVVIGLIDVFKDYESSMGDGASIDYSKRL